MCTRARKHNTTATSGRALYERDSDRARSARGSLPLRCDLVLEIGIDVIQYASNRYPEGKSEREREKGGKEREGGEREGRQRCATQWDSDWCGMAWTWHESYVHVEGVGNFFISGFELNISSRCYLYVMTIDSEKIDETKRLYFGSFHFVSHLNESDGRPTTHKTVDSSENQL